jgi:hypothetical protein
LNVTVDGDAVIVGAGAGPVDGGGVDGVPLLQPPNAIVNAEASAN